VLPKSVNFFNMLMPFVTLTIHQGLAAAGRWGVTKRTARISVSHVSPVEEFFSQQVKGWVFLTNGMIFSLAMGFFPDVQRTENQVLNSLFQGVRSWAMPGLLSTITRISNS
jgi:hypothetical protein